MEIKVGDYYIDSLHGDIDKIISTRSDAVLYKYKLSCMSYVGISEAPLESFCRYIVSNSLIKIHPTLVKLWQLDKLFENE